MLCKSFDMNNTTYITVPCLRSGYSPRNQPKRATMYSSWKEPEHVENTHPNLSGSWKKIRDNFSGNEDGGRYFDQQHNTKKLSRDFGSNLKGDQGMSETSQESPERPQFQVTIEKPVGQFLSVSSNNWRHSRRASDGAIFAPNLSGRAERRFGVVAEETLIHPANSQVSSQSSTGPRSTTPSARNRRVSVDCVSPVRKVSVVVPQPRNKENSGLRQIKSNENLSSISFDSEDTSWRELVAKAKGFRPSKSAETPVEYRANGGDFIAQTHAANPPADTDQPDGSKLRLNSPNSRSSENSSHIDIVKTNTAVVPMPTSSGLESERSSVVAMESFADSEDVKRAQIDARKKTRRFSVAAIRPTNSFARTSIQKVSGYSTHGTLEYARQLLGKLQTEGRSKSKKERLDELSKALKWILEELNRIEVPDRDLVSVFISLRAKIVNLKAEVKAEERDLSSVDLESMGRMPQILTTSEDKTRNVYSRRFSWC